MHHSQFSRLIPITLVGVLLLGACTSKSSSAQSTSVADTTAETTAETTVVSSATTGASKLEIPTNAVAIDYFVAKGNPPLLKETLVDVPKATKSVSMIVDKITYAGVVCGFSFTGKVRPTSPVKFRFQIENADLSIVDTTVDIAWDGDKEQPASGKAPGWNFLADARANRNGPGWVVQLGAVPEGGGKGKAIPKRALCTLSTDTEMPVSVGPIAYWAGFATV